jgi:ketosteroid isomerase-like protein
MAAIGGVADDRGVTELPRAVAALLDAANANDTDDFLRSLAPDAVVDDWGREFRGTDAIRGWSDREFIGVGVTLELTGVERDGDETTVAAIVGGAGFNGPSHFSFRLDGDRVARMTIRA